MRPDGQGAAELAAIRVCVAALAAELAAAAVPAVAAMEAELGRLGLGQARAAMLFGRVPDGLLWSRLRPALPETGPGAAHRRGAGCSGRSGPAPPARSEPTRLRAAVSGWPSSGRRNRTHGCGRSATGRRRRRWRCPAGGRRFRCWGGPETRALDAAAEALADPASAFVMARLDRPGALAARVILLHELIWACRHAFARPAGVAPARFPAELAACLIARPIV